MTPPEPPAVYVLVLVEMPGHPALPARRLAQVLKSCRRQHGLRCVYAVEADSRGSQSAADLAHGARDLVEQLAEARKEVARLKEAVSSLTVSPAPAACPGALTPPDGPRAASQPQRAAVSPTGDPG